MTAKKVALALVAHLVLLQAAAAPFTATSYEGLAHPYAFPLAGWEVRSLAQEAWDRLARPLAIPPSHEAALILGYFQERKAQRARVEAALEKAVAGVLRQEGLGTFPPVAFRFDSPPLLLVLSPRERIELVHTALLRGSLSATQMETLERQVETTKGVSALVEGVGGIATYPSLIPPDYGLQDTVSAVAHEWLHQYFSFRPLGRAYGRDYEMTTLNETTADMSGKEVAARVLRGYGVEPVEAGKAPETPFDREMRAIRREVDRLLGEGRVAEAEAFMEESRQRLEGMGYTVRRLNQAYFAFHGSYAQSPQSTSPMGEELRRLRQKSGSLGEFIRRVARVSSYRQLQALVY